MTGGGKTAGDGAGGRQPAGEKADGKRTDSAGTGGTGTGGTGTDSTGADATRAGNTRAGGKGRGGGQRVPARVRGAGAGPDLRAELAVAAAAGFGAGAGPVGMPAEGTFARGFRVCGVDEVGRGPLAGPVVAAAVILPAQGLPDALAGAITDSKLLSAAERERLEPGLRGHALFGLGEASVEEIDRLNILQASLLAMTRAVAALPEVPDHALIDGRFIPTGLPCPGTALIGGDRTSLSIAAASIIAKVARDRTMAELARAYPPYGWEHNAGYPTAEHRTALLRHGVTPWHRRSFGPVRAVLAGPAGPAEAE